MRIYETSSPTFAPSNQSNIWWTIPKSQPCASGAGKNTVAATATDRSTAVLLLGHLFEIALQQANLDTRTAGALARRSVAHANHVDAIGWDLMIQYQVTRHRVRHLPRVGHRGMALASGEALHFNDVTVLTLQLRCHLVECVLGLLAQYRLAGPKANLGLRPGRVLIDASNHFLIRLDAGIKRSCRLLRGLRVAGRLLRVLIGQVGLFRSHLKALLRTGIHFFDRFAMGRGQLVKFINPVPDGLHMPPHILLAGKWVSDERS